MNELYELLAQLSSMVCELADDIGRVADSDRLRDRLREFEMASNAAPQYPQWADIGEVSEEFRNGVNFAIACNEQNERDLASLAAPPQGRECPQCHSPLEPEWSFCARCLHTAPPHVEPSAAESEPGRRIGVYVRRADQLLGLQLARIMDETNHPGEWKRAVNELRALVIETFGEKK